MSNVQGARPAGGERRFGLLGTGSLAAGGLSWFAGGLLASGIGILAVVAGFLGAKRKQRFSHLGLYLGSLAALFVCLQDMGIVRRPEALESDRALLVSSIEASIEAHEILKGSPLDEEARTRLTAVLERGLAEARKVDADRIDRKIPGFADRYRAGFIQGAELLLQGIREGSSAASLRGAIHLEHWGRWYRDHRDALSGLPDPKPSIAACIATWAGSFHSR